MARQQSGRILVINPNSTEAVTDGVDRALDPLRLAGGPEIACHTLIEGPPGIESQRHADEVVAPLCALIEREDRATDAFVIACFGDPGLYAAREATAKPVFGIAESAYLYALTLGEKFGVIAILPSSVRRQRRYIRQLGLQQRYAASVAIGLGVTALEGRAVADRMIEVGCDLIEQWGAEVLILGCAGMAGQRDAVEEALGVPVVEPCQAGTARAVASLWLGY